MTFDSQKLEHPNFQKIAENGLKLLKLLTSWDILCKFKTDAVKVASFVKKLAFLLHYRPI